MRSAGTGSIAPLLVRSRRGREARRAPSVATARRDARQAGTSDANNQSMTTPEREAARVAATAVALSGDALPTARRRDTQTPRRPLSMAVTRSVYNANQSPKSTGGPFGPGISTRVSSTVALPRWRSRVQIPLTPAAFKRTLGLPQTAGRTRRGGCRAARVAMMPSRMQARCAPSVLRLRRTSLDVARARWRELVDGLARGSRAVPGTDVDRRFTSAEVKARPVRSEQATRCAARSG
jgi:hypothetical protein